MQTDIPQSPLGTCKGAELKDFYSSAHLRTFEQRNEELPPTTTKTPTETATVAHVTRDPSRDSRDPGVTHGGMGRRRRP